MTAAHKEPAEMTASPNLTRFLCRTVRCADHGQYVSEFTADELARDMLDVATTADFLEEDDFAAQQELLTMSAADRATVIEATAARMYAAFSADEDDADAEDVNTLSGWSR